MTSRFVAACLAACVLAGCAGIAQNTSPGTPREQVLQNLGKPTATYPLPAGTRLQYSGQPSGRQVYNIDLDAAGKVVAVTQMMQPGVLNRFAGGGVTAADLQRDIGPPAMVGKVYHFPGNVWTWRWEEMGIPRLFHAYVNPQGMVERALSTDEPIRPWVSD